MQNPLFLHPSDNPLSINVSKLQGAADYRSWKRSMEIQLSSKRKIGFVDGSEKRSTSENTEAIQWDTCNSMVLSWIHNNISDSMKKSVLFITSASEVWKQLEKRFQLTNGSRKYKLSKELFGMKQNGATVVDYFTSLSSVWEELDSMNLLPSVSTVGEDVTNLLKTIHTQKEEAKLFQFLNGLDDVFGPQRSQLLMITPLPSVEMACASIQQEESQREVLKNPYTFDNEMSAMFTKSSLQNDKPMLCSACGGRGHTHDKCWNVLGYPKWHYKYKPKSTQPIRHQAGRGYSPRPHFNPKGPSAAHVSVGHHPESSQVSFSPEQLQQLLQLLPTQTQSMSDFNEEAMESPFSGMITCNSVQVAATEWIMDTGATNHMTSNLKLLVNLKPVVANMTVNLPTGARAMVSHVGDVYLQNGLQLLNVLYVPMFTHNLLSIHKLAQHYCGHGLSCN